MKWNTYIKASVWIICSIWSLATFAAPQIQGRLFEVTYAPDFVGAPTGTLTVRPTIPGRDYDLISLRLDGHLILHAACASIKHEWCIFRASSRAPKSVAIVPLSMTQPVDFISGELSLNAYGNTAISTERFIIDISGSTS